MTNTKEATTSQAASHAINGVSGKMNPLGKISSKGKFTSQTWKSAPRAVPSHSQGATMTVNIRFDDHCNNGKNNFAVTADVVSASGKFLAGGCMHDEIVKAFPELAPLVKWHLTGENGPWQYSSAIIWAVSNRDDSRYEPGTPTQWQTAVKFGNSPILTVLKDKFAAWAEEQVLVGTFWTVEAVEHVNRPGDNYKFSPKYTFTGFPQEWHACPFDTKHEAETFAEAMNTLPVEFVKIPTSWAKSKVRDLNAARNCAVWPEATDEQLLSAELPQLLEQRLPTLVAAFEADMLACGFLWELTEEG